MAFNYKKFWYEEFGDVPSAKDFTGRQVNKSEYRSESEFAWDKDYIQPISNGGKSSNKNLQIVNFKTAGERANKTTFVIEDKQYQIKKTKNIKQDDELPDYNYSKKMNCIVYKK